MEIKTRIKQHHLKEHSTPFHTMKLMMTMLSDAHHLGVHYEVVVQWSIWELIATESEQPHFLVIFRHENCVSRSVSATAGLIQPLITHYDNTLEYLSTDVYETVSSPSISDLDKTTITRVCSLISSETRLNSWHVKSTSTGSSLMLVLLRLHTASCQYSRKQVA